MVLSAPRAGGTEQSAFTVPEPPDETCEVPYKEQSAQVSYTVLLEPIEGEKEKKNIHINFVIEEGASGDLVLELSNVIQETQEAIYMPGDVQPFTVSIENHSAQDYTYKDGSFVLSTAKTTDFGTLEQGALLPLLGYDGQYIPIICVGSMIPKYFMDLYSIADSSKITFKDMCQIFETLGAQDIEDGEQLLDAYMLDYLNRSLKMDCATLEELYETKPDAVAEKLFASGSTHNGIFEMSADKLEQYIADYPWIDRYLYVQAQGDTLKVQLKWPSATLAKISYDFFYQYLLHFAYGAEDIAKLDPNSWNDSTQPDGFTRTHSIAGYTENLAVWQETDRYFADHLADKLSAGGQAEFPMAFALNGPLMGNSYQNYEFSYYNVIELTPASEPVIPVGGITGTVFNDTVRDDAYTEGDTAVAGHTVELYEKTEAGWSKAGTTETDANGAYRFGDLEAGKVFRVQIMRPSALNRDCAVTYAADKTNGNRFAAGEGAYLTDEITILADTEQIANAGFYFFQEQPTPQYGGIAGTVFDDTVRDDVYTDADATVAGHVVELYEKTEAGWSKVSAVQTDANGVYRFSNLEAGKVFRVQTMRPSTLNRDCAVTYAADKTNGNRFAAGEGAYLTDEIMILADTEQTANAGFYYRSSGGGGGGGGGTTTIPDEPTPLAPGLNKDDHFAYIIGYPQDYVTGEPTSDKSRWPVRPEAHIDRQEVATIFFRLLTDESRVEAWSQTNPYADVSASRWSNNAISTMSKAGIVNGYKDGTFRPDDKITRAEFATIAARFDSSLYVGEDQFSDIGGHWAAEYINRAAQKGWIKGYPDGTFRPDQYITRAEAMTLVNAVLDRRTHAADMLDDMIKWPDNPENAWYFEAVQEATNSHDYDRENPTAYEKWTVMQPARDWALLEREWSVAAMRQAA